MPKETYIKRTRTRTAGSTDQSHLHMGVMRRKRNNHVTCTSNSEYDQGMPHSQTTDQPMALQESDTEHRNPQDS